MIDRNGILNSMIDSLKTFSANDSRKTIELVLKNEDDNLDLRKRSDFRAEAVLFTWGSGDFIYEIGEEKPSSLIKSVELTIYIESDGKISTNNLYHKRAYEIQDIISDWLFQVSAYDVDTSLYSMKALSDSRPTQEDGYITAQFNFETDIELL